MAEGVQVEGLRQVARQLRKLGVEASDLKDAFHHIGNEVAGEIRGFAPKQSGKLAGTVRASKQQSQAVVRAGRAKVPYAGPINFGWPARNIEGKHFMEQGLEAKEEWVLDELERELNKLIERIMN